MKTIILRNRLLSFVVLFFIVVSCQNKKVPQVQDTKVQSTNEKAHDELMDKVTELYNTGNYAEFIELAEIEVSKSENNSEFYLALSSAYGELGNYDKALKYVRMLLEKEPSNYHALLQSGNVFFVLEKLDSAELYYQKTLDINPDYARANLNLAQLYEKKGLKDKAVEQYLKAIKLFDENNLKNEVIQFSREVIKLDPNNQLAKEYLGPPYFIPDSGQ